MRKIIKIFQKYKYPILSLAILTILFRAWFFNFSILSTDDWYFKFNETIQTAKFWPSLWITQPFGSVNLMLSTHILNSLWAGLSFFFPFSITERLLFLFPGAILSSFGSFKLANFLLKTHKLAIISSIIYTFNTYVWVTLASGHLNIYMSYSLIPLFTLSFLKYIESNQNKYFLISLIFSLIISIYDFRFIYIILIILGSIFTYYLTFKDKLRACNTLYSMLALLVITVLSHLYWLIPLYSQDLLSGNEILTRNIFGSEFFNVTHSITLSHPYWNGWEIEHFIKHPILFTNFLLPILIVIGLVLNKNRKVLLFGIITVIGVFLTKQGSEPFGWIYLWLFNNIPGFNAFREASKFSALLYLGYSMIIANSIGWIAQKIASKTKFKVDYIQYIFIFCTLIFFTYPILFGSIKPMFSPNYIHNDYLLLKNFIKQDEETFRTLWVPTNSRWNYYDNEKGIVTFGDFIKQMQLVDLDSIDIKTTDGSDIFKHFVQTNYFSYLLNKANIKYIGIPVYDKDDDFFQFFGIPRAEIIKLLDSNTGIEKQNIGTSELIIYKVKNYRGSDLITTSDKLIKIKKGEFSNTFYQMKQLESVSFNYTFEDVDLSDNMTSLFYSPNEVIYEYFLDNTLTNEIVLNKSIFQVSYSKVQDKLKVKLNTPNLIKDSTNKLIFEESDLITKEYQFDLSPDMIYKIDINGYEHLLNEGSYDIYQGEISKFIVKQYSNDKKFKSEILNIDSNDLVPEQNKFIKKAANSKSLNIENKLDSKNILSNGDFEKGTWQAEVGNCNNFDENPIIEMNLVEEKQNKYLSLSSTRHNACTSVAFDVKGGSTYKFSFDYNTPNAPQVGYYIQYDDQNNSNESIRIDVNNNDEWNSFSKIMTVPFGTKRATLFIYSFATDLKTNIISDYDNFQFKEVMNLKDLYSIYSKSNVQLEKPQATKYQDINLTTKNISIYSAKEPFILKLAEQYNTGWDIYSEGKKIAMPLHDGRQETENFKIDGNFNGWIINPKEFCSQMKCDELNGHYTFDFQLFFTPQKTLNTSLIAGILVTPILICLYFVGKFFLWKYLDYQDKSEISLDIFNPNLRIKIIYSLLFFASIISVSLSAIIYSFNKPLADFFSIIYFFAITFLLVIKLLHSNNKIQKFQEP